jgi:hypothetical protein
MVATARQNGHFAKGTLAALDREKERVTTTLQIDHAPTVDKQTLLRAVKHTLVVSGAVDVHRTSVALVDADLQAALERSEKMLEETRKRLAEAEQKLAELKNGAGRWITLQECAVLKGVNYSTVWRAHKAGRLQTRVIGGKEKDQLLCDPTTFVPAAKSKLNKLPK